MNYKLQTTETKLMGLDKIKKNDKVKLHNSIESFWVIITNVNNESLTGIIKNELLDPVEYNNGDIINFNIKNVSRIVKAEFL